MTIKALKETMRNLNENDKESYEELWAAVRTLWNLGLVERKFVDAMVEEDNRLFNEENSGEDWSKKPTVKLSCGYGLLV